ncbi:MAG: DUF1573 domain-containing protein [Bacteroidales bacterium]|nr:DUF1573 domain-containing protein [Bacteroidales bacterium]
MNKFFSIAIAVFLGLLACAPWAYSQGSQKDNTFGGVVKLDKTVHDFGDIMVSDGPVSATFTVTNVGTKPLVIYHVASSCGCTDVEWTKQPLKPGEKGSIKATYKNDEGGYPFDKTLTVSFSEPKQPVILRLRGESHAKKLSLGEMYPVKFGNLGFKSVDIKGGNLSQGQQRSGEVVVANLGQKAIDVKFSDVSKGLSLKLSKNPIPAGTTAKLTYTVTADRDHWGKNYYYATPLVDGRSYKAVVNATAQKTDAPGTEALVADPNPDLGAGKSRIGIYTLTKEDFSSLTKEQRDAAAVPVAAESSFSFGKVKVGTLVKGSFDIANQGKSAFKVYKVDSESSHLKAKAFQDIAPGGKGKLEVTLDTTGFPKGECLIVLTLTTNSPLRPIMNLFLTGWIE